MNNKKVIFGMLSGDAKTISYRPEFSQALGGNPVAAITLQQIFYLWNSVDRKPFYKFKSPCSHNLCKEGDTWTETLGISSKMFDTAIKVFSQKLSKGSKKDPSKLVYFWTTMDRMTFYEINEKAFLDFVINAYKSKDCTVNDESAFTKSTNRDLHKVPNGIYVNPESGFTKMPNRDLHYIHKELQIELHKEQQIINTESSSDFSKPLDFSNDEIEDLERQIESPFMPKPVKAEEEKKKKVAPKKKKGKFEAGAFELAKNIWDKNFREWQLKNGVQCGENEGIYWDVKQIGNLSSFLKKLRHKATTNGKEYETDTQFIQAALPLFLGAAVNLKTWYLTSFDPTTLHGKFENVCADVKKHIQNGYTGEKSNGKRNGHNLDAGKSLRRKQIIAGLA